MDHESSKIINILIVAAFLVGPMVINFLKKKTPKLGVSTREPDEQPVEEFTQKLANFLSMANLNPQLEPENGIDSEEESETTDEHALKENDQPTREMSHPVIPSEQQKQDEDEMDEIDFDNLFNSPKSIQTAIVMREILDKPVILRRNYR